jgi:hypothetical protein
MDTEDFNILIDGLQGEDSIEELHRAHLDGELTADQGKCAWHYVMSHIENRLDSEMEVPGWMCDAQRDLYPSR